MTARVADDQAGPPRADARGEVITIVLAAGKGVRIGGPKALLAWPAEQGAVGSATATPRPGASLPHGGPARARTGAQAAPPAVPLAIAHAERRLASESARVLIVSRGTMVGALLAYARPGIDLVSSKAADELGPAGSLAFAVSRFEAGAVLRAVVVTPVDTPPSSSDTVARLLARLDAGGDAEPPLAARPRYHGRHGHPVVLRPAALERYLAPSPPPLRDHLATLGDRVVSVDVDDAAILLDLDTPSDVVKLLGAMPRFLTG